MSIPLTLACGSYDRTLALALGDVRPAGIDLTYLRLPVEEIFWRMIRHGEFDAAEMSLSSYLLRRSRGDESLVAIPVFTSRSFRHSAIYVPADGAVRRPEELRGARVGIPEYHMTAAVWVRGFLEDDYGVRPEEVRWLQGGLEQPGRVEKLAIQVPGVEIATLSEGQTLNGLLVSGGLDAVISARAPSSFDGVRVVRLFADFRTVEAEYFRRTGIFPIMHTVVLRREILDRYPWVARSLFDAFCQAKACAMRAVGSPVALAATVPWLLWEVEQARSLMGEDYWPYGLEPNRAALETLARYSLRQGLAARQVTAEELFAPSTLDEYRV